MKKYILILSMILVLFSCDTINYQYNNIIGKIRGEAYPVRYSNKEIMKFDKLVRTIYNNYYDYNDSLIKYSFIKSENIMVSNKIDSIYFGRSIKLCYHDITKYIDNQNLIVYMDGCLVYKIKDSDMKLCASIFQKFPETPIRISISFRNEKTCNHNKWERWGPH